MPRRTSVGTQDSSKIKNTLLISDMTYSELEREEAVRIKRQQDIIKREKEELAAQKKVFE